MSDLLKRAVNALALELPAAVHKDFSKILNDEIERLTALVESCSARNESDADEIERLECSLAISRKKHELAIEVNKSLQAKVDKLEAVCEVTDYIVNHMTIDRSYGDSLVFKQARDALQEVSDDE